MLIRYDSIKFSAWWMIKRTAIATPAHSWNSWPVNISAISTPLRGCYTGPSHAGRHIGSCCKRHNDEWFCVCLASFFGWDDLSIIAFHKRSDNAGRVSPPDRIFFCQVWTKKISFFRFHYILIIVWRIFGGVGGRVISKVVYVLWKNTLYYAL